MSARVVQVALEFSDPFHKGQVWGVLFDHAFPNNHVDALTASDGRKKVPGLGDAFNSIRPGLKCVRLRAREASPFYYRVEVEFEGNPDATA
jgi:hypothetical protein